MKLVNSQNRIKELLSRFVAQIEMGAATSRTDLNKAAETILIPLLNEVYGWNLKNINYAEDDNNYPGIDLADEIAKVSIQVTATSTPEKVKHTLEQFTKHSQYLKYDRLIVYILTRKRSSYPEKTIQKIIQNKFSFDIRKDIWDCCNLIKEVDHFQTDRILKVQEILEANFGDEKGLLTLSTSRLKQRIDWRETCRELLNHWKGLTTNALTKPNGVRFQLDEIFVPLGVVERQQKPKHSPTSNSPEQGSELYEEKVTPINQDAFFEQVLRQRQSKHSQGRRIAIIGEPGAGKTTQLQKIGDWILKEEDIPIWIPLAAVGTKPLKQYLLHDWLQTAIQELDVLQKHRDELGQLLETGKVWLLLDGVDEMVIPDALHQIATQMWEGWLQNVRVVLTCRLNVWDAGKNALDGFDVYRNLDFEYPTEVHQFIDQWFATEPELQQKLKVALEQLGKERIRDMVKNPLRLTLLCYSWQLRQGELPETKAGLYEWFVDAFYEWNKGKAPTKLNVTRRKELNCALGELAKKAIDQESSRFRLREKFINQFLGDADDEDSLFYLALQLGWLNRIGVAEENPLEDVYAFFHPTLQEYFAALAIDDWHYFLNHVPHNPDEGKYLVFQIHWHEVILLWCGIDKKNALKEESFNQKEEFLDSMISFEDGCNHFYESRAFFLAVDAANEFRYSKQDIIDLFMNSPVDDLLEYDVFQHKIYLPTIELSMTIKKVNYFFELIGRLGFDAKKMNVKKLSDIERSFSSFDKQVELFVNYFLKESNSNKDKKRIKNSLSSKKWLDEVKVSEGKERGVLISLFLQEYKENPNYFSHWLLETIDVRGSELWLLAWLLGKNVVYEFETLSRIVCSLLSAMATENDGFTLISIAESLKQIQSSNSDCIKISDLKPFLLGSNTSSLCKSLCMELLYFRSQGMNYPDFYRAWHSSSVDVELPTDDGEVKP